MNTASENELKYAKTINSNNIDFGAVTRLCRRGLPLEFRPYYWKIIMGFYTLSKDTWLKTEERSRKEYDKILSTLCTVDEKGHFNFSDDLLKVIDLDIPRTMTDLSFFVYGGMGDGKVNYTESQHCLRRVIYLISKVNKGIGYVQGMNEFAALLLYTFSKGNPSDLSMVIESECFFCFQTLLGYLGDDFCKALDQDSDIGVRSTMRLFDNAMLFFDPALFRHLSELGITSEHYALRWILLLFIQEFDISSASRVWDFLLSFGDDLKSVSFFVSVAMCHNIRERIFEADSLSEVIPLLHHYPVSEVENALRIAMRWIVQCGANFIPKLKNANEDDIAAYRKTLGFDGPSDSFVGKKKSWLSLLFTSK